MKAEPARAPRPTDPQPDAATREPRVPPPGASLEPKPESSDAPDAIWDALRRVVGDRPSALARLESVRLVRIDGGVAVVRPVAPAHASRVRAGVGWFEQHLSEAAGRAMKVRVEDQEADDDPTPAPDPTPADEAALRREAESNKLVRTAMDLFQARLVRIDPAPDRPGDTP